MESRAAPGPGKHGSSQPEPYIGGALNLFDSEGKLTNESTREFLAKFVQAAWIAANHKR